MITIRVNGDRELMAKFNLFPKNLQVALYKKMVQLAIQLEAHVKRDKLDGQVLNVRSGDLSRSIAHEVTQSENSVIARVFSGGNVPYAAIHEYGGRTAPHDIYPKDAEALFFRMGGHDVFAKVVHHPGSQMPQRSYMRSALNDYREQIIEGIESAVQEAWK